MQGALPGVENGTLKFDTTMYQYHDSTGCITVSVLSIRNILMFHLYFYKL